MDIGNLISIAIAAIFVNNFVFSRTIGICPYLGVSKHFDSAFGMGMAVIFVLVLASIVTWCIDNFILQPLGLVNILRTVAFILTIASLVQFVEMFLKKTIPGLYKALGIYLPLITTNCVILAVTILNVQEKYNLIQTIVFSFASGIGFTIALLAMAAIRERLELSPYPKSLRGFSIALIMAGLMSLAFLGFAGLAK